MIHRCWAAFWPFSKCLWSPCFQFHRITEVWIYWVLSVWTLLYTTIRHTATPPLHQVLVTCLRCVWDQDSDDWRGRTHRTSSSTGRDQIYDGVQHTRSSIYNLHCDSTSRLQVICWYICNESIGGVIAVHWDRDLLNISDMARSLTELEGINNFDFGCFESYLHSSNILLIWNQLSDLPSWGLMRNIINITLNVRSIVYFIMKLDYNYSIDWGIRVYYDNVEVELLAEWYQTPRRFSAFSVTLTGLTTKMTVTLNEAGVRTNFPVFRMI